MSKNQPDESAAPTLADAEHEAILEEAALDRAMKEDLGLRTKPATPRLNFEIPGEILRGIKVAAALQDSTIRKTVIQILDEWLRAHPDLSSYSYGETAE